MHNHRWVLWNCNRQAFSLMPELICFDSWHRYDYLTIILWLTLIQFSRSSSRHWPAASRPWTSSQRIKFLLWNNSCKKRRESKWTRFGWFIPANNLQTTERWSRTILELELPSIWSCSYEGVIISNLVSIKSKTWIDDESFRKCGQFFLKSIVVVIQRSWSYNNRIRQR